MEWGKLFANLPDDPRVQAAEAEGGAGWLLIESMCYCTRSERGGFIPHTQVDRFGGPRLKQRVAALVREQLWLPVDGGYHLNPDVWSEERNLSDAAEKKKAADRERARVKRAAEKHDRETAGVARLSRDNRATGSATDRATDGVEVGKELVNSTPETPEIPASNRDFPEPSEAVDNATTCGNDDPTPEMSRDNRTVEKSREEKRRTRAGLVSQLQVPSATAKSDDDDETVSRVAGAIAERLGCIVSPAQARRAIRIVLERAKRSGKTVGDAVGYVTRAVEAEDDPWRELLCPPADELAAEVLGDVPGRPPWCGVCDEVTRQLDRDGDHPSQCPDCHPETARRIA